MVTKHATGNPKGNPKGNPLVNCQFSCTLLRADLSQIEIICISCTNKLSLGFLFGFPSCKGSFSCIYPKATLWDLLSFPKYLELWRRKCLQQPLFLIFLRASRRVFHCNSQKSPKRLPEDSSCIQKNYGRKSKNGGEGAERGRKRAVSLKHMNTEFIYVRSRSDH